MKIAEQVFVGDIVSFNAFGDSSRPCFAIVLENAERKGYDNPFDAYNLTLKHYDETNLKLIFNDNLFLVSRAEKEEGEKK